MVFIYLLKICATSINPSSEYNPNVLKTIDPTKIKTEEINELAGLVFDIILTFKEFENREATEILDGELWQNSFLFKDMVKALITNSKFPESNQGHIFHDFMESLAKEVYYLIYVLSLYKGKDIKSEFERCDLNKSLQKALVADENNLISGLPVIKTNDKEMETLIKDYRNCFYDNEQVDYKNEELIMDDFQDLKDADLEMNFYEYPADYSDQVIQPNLISNGQDEYKSAIIMISIATGASLVALIIFIIYFIKKIKTFRPIRNIGSGEVEN